MKSYFLILVVLLCGCVSNQRNLNPSQVAWDFRPPSSGAPKGKVFLNVKGESYQIISRATARYRELDRPEFEDYNIPSNAITAAASSYNEPGDLLYVVKNSNQLEVFRREMDKNETSNFIIEKISIIPL